MTATDRRKTTPFEPDFEELFAEHSRLIYCAAYSVTGHRQDAEDVLQTVMLKLIRRQDLPADAFENPRGYMYRAAVNEALSIVRSPERQIEKVGLEDVELPAHDAEAGGEDDHKRLVRAAIEKLDPDSLSIVMLHYQEGFTGVEIARMLGQSRSAVAMTLLRARDEIRKRVGVRGVNR